MDVFNPSRSCPERRWVSMVLLVTVLFLIIPITSVAQTTWNRHDDLFSASFPTPMDGWACGRWGSLWHTSDGGKTWNAQDSGTDRTLACVFFVDARTGWIVGADGIILNTTDGGQTWNQQKSPTELFHMGVHFIDANKGWVASEETNILYTEDGGETWVLQYEDEIFRFKGISFSDDQNGWAVGEYGFIYGTHDGGKTWTQQGGRYEYDEESGELHTGVFLFDVAAIDAQTAIAVGADSRILMTQDGGASWQQLDAGLDRTQLFGVAFDGKDTLAIAGKGAYLLSEDRGKTWKPIRFEPSMIYNWMYDFAPQGSGNFMAVGEEGAIYLSKSKDLLERVDY
ncbi:MAG: hypothetical protein JRH15_18180 [Deltaproteobacteria bacterium]|nr:hypothetical protein [Deltaproteobacteria bacterium]